MADIDVTEFFENEDPQLYSGSVAERGKNAAQETWAAAQEKAGTLALLKTERELDEFRAHVAELGAWEQAEIDGWSAQDYNALFLQMLSADIRESGLDMAGPDWEECEKGAKAGQNSGRLFPSADDGRIFYYIGC